MKKEMSTLINVLLLSLNTSKPYVIWPIRQHLVLVSNFIYICIFNIFFLCRTKKKIVSSAKEIKGLLFTEKKKIKGIASHDVISYNFFISLHKVSKYQKSDIFFVRNCVLPKQNYKLRPHQRSERGLT